MSKLCQYGCGTKIFWNNNLEGKLKWCEETTKLKHDYPRCAELLKAQGKDVGILKKKKDKKQDVKI